LCLKGIGLLPSKTPSSSTTVFDLLATLPNSTTSYVAPPENQTPAVLVTILSLVYTLIIASVALILSNKVMDNTFLLDENPIISTNKTE
jgi:hypothetical protein